MLKFCCPEWVLLGDCRNFFLLNLFYSHRPFSFFVNLCTVSMLRPEEGVRSPKSGVTYRCELPSRFWELNQGPLSEQQVLLIAEPFLQSYCKTLKRRGDLLPQGGVQVTGSMILRVRWKSRPFPFLFYFSHPRHEVRKFAISCCHDTAMHHKARGTNGHGPNS